MKTLLPVCLLLCTFRTAEAQFSRYNILISEAVKAEEKNAPELAVSLYDSAFAIIDFIPYHYFYAFGAAARTGNWNKAEYYLVRGTLKGLNISQWSSPELQAYLNHTASARFRAIRDSLEKAHVKSLDTTSYFRLLRLKELDQKARDGSKASGRQDSLNFEELIRISENFGFPAFPTAGYGQHIAFLVLWHQRDTYPSSGQWKRILPLIMREIGKGRIDPAFLKPLEEQKVRRP
jgi:hypothetical protein